jgi:hypothetical protein
MDSKPTSDTIHDIKQFQDSFALPFPRRETCSKNVEPLDQQ